MSPDAFLQTCHEAREIETRARIGRRVALREASDDVPRVSRTESGFGAANV